LKTEIENFCWFKFKKRVVDGNNQQNF
jgi:hypothetical protein